MLSLGALRDALIEAGASREKADAAAEEVVGYVAGYVEGFLMTVRDDCEARFASMEARLEKMQGRSGDE